LKTSALQDLGFSRRLVDRLEIGRHVLAFFIADEAQAMPRQMYDASLDCRLRENGLDLFRHAFCLNKPLDRSLRACSVLRRVDYLH